MAWSTAFVPGLAHGGLLQRNGATNGVTKPQRFRRANLLTNRSALVDRHIPTEIEDREANERNTGEKEKLGVTTNKLEITANEFGVTANELGVTVPIAKEDVSSENTTTAVRATSPFAYLWPRALLLGVAAIWGTNFGVVKMLDESLRPSASAMTRFVLAAVALSPALLNAPKEVIWKGLGIGQYVFAGYFLQAVALRYSESNKIAFLCSLAVVFVPLLNKLVPEKNEVEKKGVPLVSIMLAVAGVGMLELGGDTTPTVGDALGLLQALFFAAGFVFNERAMAKYPSYPLALTAAQLLTVGGLSTVWYVLDSTLLYGSFDLQGITVAASDPLISASLVYTGLITTALAIVMENFALRNVSASELSIILSTEPFFAAAFSSFLLNESLSSKGVFGGVLIIAACLSDQLSGAISKLRKKILPEPLFRWSGDRSKQD